MLFYCSPPSNSLLVVATMITNSRIWKLRAQFSGQCNSKIREERFPYLREANVTAPPTAGCSTYPTSPTVVHLPHSYASAGEMVRIVPIVFCGSNSQSKMSKNSPYAPSHFSISQVTEALLGFVSCTLGLCFHLQ